MYNIRIKKITVRKCGNVVQERRSGSVRIFSIITALLVLVLIGVLSYANVFHFAAHMDSDAASEAILAREIALNDMRTPDTWIISTETRHIYPANLAAPIYFLTDSLQLSMGLAATLCGLLLALCMYHLYKRAGLSGPATALAILIPFSASVNLHDYLEMFFMYAGYYFPVLAGLYLTLIFYEEIIRQKNYLFYVISLLIAAILGTQGMRGVLMVYLPILSAHVLKIIIKAVRKKPLPKREYLTCLWLFILTLLSAVTCKVASSGVSGTSRNIRHGFEKLFSEVLPSVAVLFTKGTDPLITVLGAGICIAGLFISVYLLFVDGSFDSDIRWTLLASLWAGAAVMILAMAFTTFEVAPRYSLYIMFAAGCGIGMYMDHTRFRTRAYIRALTTALYVAAIACGILSCTWNVNNLILKDGSESSPYLQVEAYMKENGIDTGYAVFDFASDMTVTCNERVNIYPVNSLGEMEGCKWLSNETWYPPVADKDRQVLVMTTDSTDGDFQKFLAGTGKDMITDSARIAGFNCYILESDPVVWTR